MRILESLNKSVWAFRNQFSPIPDYDFNSEGELVQNYSPIKWTPSAVFELIVSGIIGLILGVLVALVVNGALVEISLSTSFTMYFGFLFIIMGIVVVWRTLSSSNTLAHPDEVAAARAPRRHLIAFAILNIVTGLCCFVLQRNMLLLMSPLWRTVIYSLLGMSSSFALTFGIVDLVNLTVGFCRPESARPLVESILQIYVVVVASLSMGAFFGCIFGRLDVGSAIHPAAAISNFAGATGNESMTLANLVDLRLCLPIGGIFGALAGLANEYIRRVELAFNKLDQPVEFECDI